MESCGSQRYSTTYEQSPMHHEYFANFSMQDTVQSICMVNLHLLICSDKEVSSASFLMCSINTIMSMLIVYACTCNVYVIA